MEYSRYQEYCHNSDCADYLKCRDDLLPAYSIDFPHSVGNSHYPGYVSMGVLDFGMVQVIRENWMVGIVCHKMGSKF
jgi:hypothetical protein